MKQPFITLNDGNTMPQFGLGVWQATDDQAAAAIEVALEAGYRAIDTAAIYENEKGVGQALKNTAIARDELFITTKLWNTRQHEVEQALSESLEKLQLDYIDLYLIHWPQPAQDRYISAWENIIRMQEKGLIKSIGVCNFNIPHLQRLIDETHVKPVVNQIELHPLMQQEELRHWHHEQQIVTESWSPLAQGGEGVFTTPIIEKLAKKYGKTPAQIVIRWHLDLGLVVIPKSVTPSRIRENINVFDFKLEQDELAEIAKLHCGKRLGPDPETF